ncbi:MAG: hypothetical protein K2X93_21260 [Candidatus Obscuribacterales bacterium]|nr:hypothetical protein [Candidatus Obscuribacterales bacterium]
MSEEITPAIQFEVLAARLKDDHGASVDLLELLAKMLDSSYSSGTKITRGGWIMSKERPIEELSVRFDEWQFQITRAKHGTVNASSKKLVRGVALKTNEISLEQCIEEILKEVVKLSEKNSQTRAALDKFITGL